MLKDLLHYRCFHWEYCEMFFAEKYKWQHLGNMSLLERRRKMDLIEALDQAKRSAANKTPGSAPAPGA